MAVALAVQPAAGERVLDLCAAPGGKTTALGALLDRRGGGVLVANEIHPTRVLALAENVERMGVSAAIVNEQPQRLADAWPGQFDAILVDAPCSGEGMFRKDPEAIAAWTADAPRSCAERQREIVHSAVQMLKPGGRIIYSTCTFNPEENEGIVAWMLKTFPLELETLPDWPGWSPARSDWADEGIDLSGARRLWPHQARGEGHFVARLKLTSALKDEPAGRTRSAGAARGARSSRKEAVLQIHESEWTKWLRDLLVDVPPHLAKPLVQGEIAYADLLGPLANKGLRVLRPGVPVAVIESKDRLVPHHALAKHLSPSHFRHAYVCDGAEALAYLSGSALDNAAGLKGYVHVSFDGHGLGFAKGVPGRLNNLYPKGLRSNRLILPQ